MKKILSILLTICMIATIISSIPITTFAATNVSRAEWITNIVETFGMYVEDDIYLPDNYFGDISPDMEYYRDILLAVEFGVIDLAAGENFKPDEPVTREFAAHTLNYCLNFQLEEDAEYTYSEADTVTYPDDIQIAVNRGWFALSGGKFLPEQNITQEESTAMLADAATILESDVINEDYDSKFDFADGVVVIPQGTDISISEDYTVKVTDYKPNVKVGDVFVVFTGEIPVALVATAVSVDGSVTTITSTPEGAKNAIVSVDSEGVTEIDLENFTVAEAETFSITDTESNDVQLMSIAPRGIDYDKKTKTLTATKDVKLSSVCAGSITVEVSDLKLYHKENTGRGDYEAYITAKTVVTKTISFDFGSYVGLPNSIVLGYIPLEGIGDIRLEVDISLKGGMSETQEGNIMAGFGYTRNDGFRLIKGYKQTSYSFTAEAEVKIGLTYSVNINLVVVSGRIWATVGVRGTYHFKDFTYVDQNRPLQCETIKAYLYANVGVSVSISYFVDQQSWSKVHHIYDEDNSPARVYYHYEDGELVDACTRSKENNETYTKYTTKTTSKYFNPAPSYSRSSYTDSSTGTTTTLWTYTLDSSNNATITGYKGYATAIAIPSKIDGYTVTTIGSKAFENNTALKSVTMADSVVTVNNSAFLRCENLTYVKLSKNLEYLGAEAFGYCNKLNNIEIPKSLNECDYRHYGGSTYRGVFNECTSLKNIKFEEGITKIPNKLFATCIGIENITIPDTVTEIGDSAFYECKSLAKVTASDNIVKIYSKAFYNCENLTDINLPKNLEYLDAEVFGYCNKLNNIEIPKSLNECDYRHYGGSTYRGVFNECTSLKNIKFEEGITKIPNKLFATCIGIENITIPDTVTEIGDSAFYECKSLAKVTASDNIVKIYDKAFYNCENLTSINLSKNLEYLGGEAFGYCNKLNNIEIPKSLNECDCNHYGGATFRGVFNECSSLKNIVLEEGITKIPNYLFATCTGIENITIPDMVTEIGDWAFYECKGLKSIIIPNTITEITSKLFSGCIALEEIVIPDTVTSFGTNVFAGCTALKKVKLSNNFDQIPSYTFYNCNSLNEVDFPENLTVIDNNAFYGCTSLESIVFPETLKEIKGNAFYGCSKLNNLKLPDSLTTISGSAFYENKALTEISIPENVSTIGSSAFQNCDALTKAEIKGSGTIGEKAFYDCDVLESIIIGDKVTTLGKNMCYGCDKLTDIKLGKGITTIPDSAFRLCQSLETVTIPRFCTTIAANAFSENTKLSSAYIPASVTSMQSNSFSYPAKMTMYGKSGSYAEEYANSRNMTFMSVEAPITKLELIDNPIVCDKNKTFLLAFSSEPEFDTDTLTFNSSDSSVATISEIGSVYTKKYGTTTLTVSNADGSISKSYLLTVANEVINVNSVSLSKTNVTMEIGKTETLTAIINPNNATNKNVSWTSSNTNVATVSNGIVTAKAPGTTTITVTTADGNKTATCTVTVSQPSSVSVTGVKLDKTSTTLTVGATETLTATVLPSNATNKNISWSSSNTSVATVSNGVITAKATGTAIITVKTADGNKTATCTVTVNAATVPVTGVKLNKTSTRLTVGDTETLTATILPSNATNKNVTWSSSNTLVATVDNGVVTAVGAGTATITVTTEQWSYVADCTVTVTSIIDENSPVIKVNNSKGYIGKTVDIVINVENNPGIAILGFNVNYDKSAMTLKSATLGEIFSGDLECNIASVPFVFNVYSGSENKTNDGKLVTLQFEIKPDCAEGDYTISLSNIEALNIAENDVTFETVNGTITITNSIPGDVTGDGKVTRADLLRLAKSFSGFEVEMDMTAADVTGDGKVTRGDLLRLAKHFSGFDVTLGK